LVVDGKTLGEKDSDRMKDLMVSGVNEVTRNFGKKVLFGAYRGFDVHICPAIVSKGENGFCFTLKGAGDQEFKPENLVYGFEGKFSLSGLFQRIDNFLAKGLDEAVEHSRDRARREATELETVKTAMDKEFPQQGELALVRENHSAIIRELQRMQDDSRYISTWEPKTSLVADQPPRPAPVPIPASMPMPAPEPRLMMRCG
jgi:hypothetical protein